MFALGRRMDVKNEPLGVMEHKLRDMLDRYTSFLQMWKYIYPALVAGYIYNLLKVL
jgi:hypothetical protein